MTTRQDAHDGTAQLGLVQQEVKSDTGYQCIVADPPWWESGGGGRGAQNHYPLLRTPDIIRVMYQSGTWRPASNAHLWLWATNNFLEDGLFVMRALGFRYITNFAWAKDRIGIGQYSRGQHELLLFGVRGRLPAVRKMSTLIKGVRERHSAKPEQSYVTIEATSPGPRLEMFAREPRAGWDVWGNEVGVTP